MIRWFRGPLALSSFVLISHRLRFTPVFVITLSRAKLFGYFHAYVRAVHFLSKSLSRPHRLEAPEHPCSQAPTPVRLTDAPVPLAGDPTTGAPLVYPL